MPARIRAGRRRLPPGQAIIGQLEAVAVAAAPVGQRHDAAAQFAEAAPTDFSRRQHRPVATRQRLLLDPVQRLQQWRRHR